MEKMSNKIKRINFEQGIRANDIQYNFDVLDDQLKRERARIGGYGIVEGFEMEVLSSTQIKINKGVIINKKGEELLVPEQIAHIADPVFVEHKLSTHEEALTVNAQGEIELPNYPYSDKKKGYIDTNFYQTHYPDIEKELLIRDAQNPDVKIRANKIEGKTVTLDANRWAGKKVFVEYLHTKNRIDTILINENGELEIEQGIISSSPSHVNLNRYEDYFVLAVVEVIVGKEVTLKVHEDLRSFRKVYVDKENRLYLNGKLYKETQVIYFEEPENPQINDIWYDAETNKLMIWKDKDGTLGWVVINEEKHVPVKEVKIISPEEFPEDNQTFIFGKEDINMRFIPGHNQLEIIIDNAPLMADQYEEIVDDEIDDYVNKGIGFKLKDPLDRATYIEVRVLHTVHASPIRRTFQRTATFVHESFILHSELNTEQIYETEIPYIIGEKQLEVYLNGVRMERTLDFDEIMNDGSAPTKEELGKSTKKFRLLREVRPGDKISYRITKNVYSYDHLEGWVDEIEEKADQALEEIDEIREDIKNMDESIQSKFKTIDNNIIEMAKELAKNDQFIKKTDKLNMQNMPDEVTNNLFGSSFAKVFPAESVTLLEDLKETDFVLVFYMTENESRVLLKDIDYVLKEERGNLLLVLNSPLVESTSSIYVTGIKFGR